jgi:MbtH protein
MSEEKDKTIYEALVNHEEQYSIWPAEEPIPAGWRKAGKRGSGVECLAFVEESWTDMRSPSLRQQISEKLRRASP